MKIQNSASDEIKSTKKTLYALQVHIIESDKYNFNKIYDGFTQVFGVRKFCHWIH